MENEKLMLIINPISGVRKKAGFAQMLTERLEHYGFDVDARITTGKGHATQLAQEAVADDYDAVAVCGGDGTVNETARALRGTGVAMGIIPSGSGNGLARHFGIPIDEIKSVDVIGLKHTVMCDCGMVNRLPFFCTFGMGYDASVSHRFAHESRRGKMSYIKSMIEEFAKHKPAHFEIQIGGDTIEREAYLVACCNASQYGNNAFIAPQASVTDGLLDVVVLKSGNVFELLQAGVDIMIGMAQYNPHFEVFHAEKVVIKHPGSALAHVDGEPITLEGDAVVQCQPAQLKIYYDPRTDKPFTPIITPLELTLRDWGTAIEKIFRHNS